MSFNAERAFDLMKRIGFTRVAGTPEEFKAANILMDEIRSIGLEPELESFTIPDAVNNKATLEILEPYQASYEVTAYKCCQNTPEEGITADFVYVQDCSDACLLGVKGKIVLINGVMRLNLYRKLLELGVAGVITMSGSVFGRPEDDDLFTRKIRGTLSAFGLLTAANIRTRDAFDMIVKGASRVRLTVSGENCDITSHNVLVTIPGTEYPDEIVSFGAHYDSVAFSTGVYDNAAGSAVLMEVLRWYAEHPSKRTLRFNWYGAEELGLEGSKAFTRNHEDELPRHRMMINLDVGGCVIGQDWARVCGDVSIVHACDAFMKMRGYTTSVGSGTQSSDGMPFADKGVPVINFFRSGPETAAVMHDRRDVIDYLSADALAKTGIPVIDWCSQLTEAVVFPFERTMPADMVTTIDNYFFKKELAEAENLKK